MKLSTYIKIKRRGAARLTLLSLAAALSVGGTLTAPVVSANALATPTSTSGQAALFGVVRPNRGVWGDSTIS